ncbi:MAG TPA: flagellar hook-basal body complex protein FliE [Terracidiphilus sp.]|jgi:flagellar hook-basal body complex protein FliE
MQPLQPILNSLAASIPALSDLPNLSNVTGTGGLPSATGEAAGSVASTGPAPFSDLLTDAVGQVNQLQDQATAAVTGLMNGNGVDVHQAMIATQKESMAFELTLAVRNKAVQAYQSVLGMQF